MNGSQSPMRSRRFRYGGVALALTCALVAAVILFNALFSMLAEKFLWYTDMTTESLYTLSDAAIETLKGIDTQGQDVKIIFCDVADNLMEESTQRMVYMSAKEMAEKLDYIQIEHVDIYREPTKVSQYKTNSKTKIYSTSVIVASGSEFRLFALRAFFNFEETDSSTPVAYNGEKKLVAAIMAVTQAESPVACVTYTHAEPFLTESELATSASALAMLEDAGYKVQPIDLATEDIPEDCRLLFIYDPKDDFIAKEAGVSDISEIEVIDNFLHGDSNAMAVFIDPATPKLTNLEEYLEEWGISFMRTEDTLGTSQSCVVRDNSNSLTADGLTIVGSYTTQGLGASIHKDMRTQYPPKVIFKNVMPINYSDRYSMLEHVDEDDSSNNYTYGTSRALDGIDREIYDVFLSSTSAKAVADGREISSATQADPYKLMTITRETQRLSNTEFTQSYVLACGSTEFLSNSLLQSNSYGNYDVMLSAMRAMGREYVPVGLETKMFESTEIEGLTTAEANRYTVALTLIPPVIVFAVGCFVLVRRRYA